MPYRGFNNLLSQNTWYLDPQWWAIAVALFLGTGILQSLMKGFWKPKIQPNDEPIRTSQTVGDITFVYQRLVIKNIGSVGAKNVRVLLIYEKAPENFIPIPLNWTHWNKSSRDIPRGEPAYIDLLRKPGSYPNYQFCWAFDVGFSTESILIDFKPELGNIRLEFFDDHGKVGNIKLQFSAKEDKLKVTS
ncbi:MAG: hypothetical protein UR31_C0037G0003 [Parcubacteria group bacterium GW2011_GWA2_33_14]|uniref:Uncharacterized protein n=1 Tax=Candidatus Staskawiczbacteria bacterium RIFCSPHIGHO2_02_FULL_33_16 TaxID=1802204 RepID=A0A1G2HXQ1_9BACT|nr:MAG: hypothetical protein UR31_C0037G0003 [Parcubacteria group bacterium GW2011_GWA2_33_14]OGZ67336.1 MAG: hypothetical protein A3D34_02770 [Candidatus Staskawiczbacteria bacterium RIFCSPHIGHO2_02_FULL_33_16]